jgi:hypothetical protein
MTPLLTTSGKEAMTLRAISKQLMEKALEKSMGSISA